MSALPVLVEEDSSFFVPFLPTGDFKLKMPPINLDGEVTALATVPEVVEALESCAVTWQKLISTALEEQLKKIPQVMVPKPPQTPSCFYSYTLQFPTRI